MEAKLNNTKLILMKGDITQQDTEAIVNAANSSLLGGGGVDGAIHRAGGPQILAECQEIRKKQGGCPPGQAVITSGGNLKAKYVIHAVGPIWVDGQHGEDETLRSAYINSLKLAAQHGISSVSFPSISTGAYRFPIDRAAQIALKAVKDFLLSEKHNLKEVRFVLFTDRDLQQYELAWEKASERLD